MDGTLPQRASPHSYGSQLLALAGPLPLLLPFAVAAGDVTFGSVFNLEPLYPPRFEKLDLALLLLAVAIFFLRFTLEEF